MLEVRITIIQPHVNPDLDKRVELHFTNVEATLEAVGADKDLLKPLMEAHGDTSKIEVGAPDPAHATINNVEPGGGVKTSVVSLLDLLKK
ncbi:MAG TPA: hypothetical protein VHA33_29190 [Candidatus Angelobacter sp.]|nr:hypothetical protein [Candidatus Angelobacter sp.]